MVSCLCVVGVLIICREFGSGLVVVYLSLCAGVVGLGLCVVGVVDCACDVCAGGAE